MKKIESLSEYRALLGENKKTHNGIDKNCFLLPSGMEKFISAGKVYYRSYDQGILIFIDENSYYNLYYYIEKGSTFPVFSCEKPVLIEELSQNGSRDAYIAANEARLKAAGFGFYRKSFQYEIGIGAEEQQRFCTAEKEQAMKASGFRYDTACYADFRPQIISLWKASLDFGDISGDDLALELSQDEELLTVIGADGDIACTYLYEIVGRDVSEGRHVVTNPSCYRKGLGSFVLGLTLDHLRTEGIKRHYTWIHEQNIPSVRMHERLGFLRNGRSSIQYILK